MRLVRVLTPESLIHDTRSLQSLRSTGRSAPLTRSSSGWMPLVPEWAPADQSSSLQRGTPGSGSTQESRALRPFQMPQPFAEAPAPGHPVPQLSSYPIRAPSSGGGQANVVQDVLEPLERDRFRGGPLSTAPSTRIRAEQNPQGRSRTRTDDSIVRTESEIGEGAVSGESNVPRTRSPSK